MQLLHIRLFGGLQVRIGTRDLSSKIGPAAGALLAYLAAHHERFHRRESLATIFWPELEGESARRCLNTTLWRLRKVLEFYPAHRGTYLATTSQGEVSITNVWIDIKAFEKTARDLVAGDDADGPGSGQFESALALYVGDALEGLYHDWAIHERDRLQFLFLECLRRQMHRLAKQQDYVGAIACGKKILQQDPLQESIHRAIINLHLEHGNRGLAAKQFDICQQLLKTELGVQPEPQTLALRRLLNTPARDRKPVLELDQLRRSLGEIRRLLDFVESQMEGLTPVGGLRS